MKTKYALPVFIIIILFSFLIESNAQDLRPVVGTVTSFKKIGLNNARISAEKSGEVAITDSMGNFSIKCLNKDVLKVTASGFGDRKIKVGNESAYKIDLLFNDNVKNFDAAVSNGHVSALVLRNAIFENESKNTKDYSNYKSIYELIASEIYEVSVNGTVILNKKIKSFDSTPEVLLVVDEKIVRDISYVSPNYVKSVEFVEDVGATMYGSMAANGVLKITLK
jgi:hypothetical protein